MFDIPAEGRAGLLSVMVQVECRDLRGFVG